MRTLAVITLFLYSLLLITIGTVLMSLSLEIVSIDEVNGVIYHLYQLGNFKIIMGSIGALLVIITLLSLRMILSHIQRQKNIAFTNPDGEVSIALVAIEDLIKKLGTEVAEVKDLRADVKATKKGISIFCKTVLWSGIQIPEITSKVQLRIKDQLQHLLGIEDTINVKMHIIKIVQKDTAKQEKKKIKKTDQVHQFKGIEYSEV